MSFYTNSRNKKRLFFRRHKRKKNIIRQLNRSMWTNEIYSFVGISPLATGVSFFFSFLLHVCVTTGFFSIWIRTICIFYIKLLFLFYFILKCSNAHFFSSFICLIPMTGVIVVVGIVDVVFVEPVVIHRHRRSIHWTFVYIHIIKLKFNRA